MPRFLRFVVWILLVGPVVSSGQQDFDILHYEADITLREPPTLYAQGMVDIHVLWDPNVADRILPIHARGIRVDSTACSGRTLQIERDTAQDPDRYNLYVPHEDRRAAHVIDTVRVWFSGTMTNEGGSDPWGGVWYEDGVLYALGVGFANTSVTATRHWLPCFDHPSDKATFRGTFRIPSSLVCVSVGVLERDTVLPSDQLRVITWEESHPTATYALTFAVGEFQKLDLTNSSVGGVSSVPHHVYSQPGDSSASSIAYSLTPLMTRHYEALFGAYPFHKVGYVNTSRGAMEHQTMISMPVSVVRKADSMHSTIAHELVHQWFGDYVTPQDFRHAWLTEAYATYGESAWIEHRLGWQAYLESIERGTQRYLQTIAPEEGVLPLVDYPRDAPSSNYPGTIYQKGRVVVAMMRALAGDSAFYQSLRDYLRQHAYGTATTSDMREVMRSALGARTDAFFEEWIVGRGWPILSVSYEQQIDQQDTTLYAVLRQEQQNLHGWQLFTTLPLDVTYTAPDGERVNELIVMTEHTLRIPLGFASGFAINAGTLVRSLVEIQEP